MDMRAKVWLVAAVVLGATLAAHLGLLSGWLPAVPGLDKALHFLLAGGVAGTATAACRPAHAGRILVVLALLAGADEALQALSPARTADLVDLGADLAGIALFSWLASRLARR
jgi:VanZ family protein